MAEDTELSDRLGGLLAWVWGRHEDPRFLDYLSITYSEAITDLPRFEKICIGRPRMVTPKQARSVDHKTMGTRRPGWLSLGNLAGDAPVC